MSCAPDRVRRGLAFLVHKSMGDSPESPVWRGISVIGPAFGTHGFDQRADVLGWRELGNSVAKVKDVAVAFSIGSKNASYTVGYRICTGK